MGDKNPKTTHKQAVQKQSKVDTAKEKKSAADAAKNSTRQTALFGAAAYGQLNTVTLLVERGADVQAQMRHGLTAAEWARRLEVGIGDRFGRKNGIRACITYLESAAG